MLVVVYTSYEAVIQYKLTDVQHFLFLTQSEIVCNFTERMSKSHYQKTASPWQPKTVVEIRFTVRLIKIISHRGAQEGLHCMGGKITARHQEFENVHRH